jgi:hypothetical protein
LPIAFHAYKFIKIICRCNSLLRAGQTHLNFACFRLSSVIIYTTRYAGGTETLRKLFYS